MRDNENKTMQMTHAKAIRTSCIGADDTAVEHGCLRGMIQCRWEGIVSTESFGSFMCVLAFLVFDGEICRRVTGIVRIFRGNFAHCARAKHIY